MRLLNFLKKLSTTCFSLVNYCIVTKSSLKREFFSKIYYKSDDVVFESLFFN